MMKKTLIQSSLIVVVLITSFFILRASTPRPEKSTCKECVDRCPKLKNKATAPGGMIWDNLSYQLFSYTSTTN